MNDPQPPPQPYQPPPQQYTPPPPQPPVPQQPSWPAQPMPSQMFATRAEQRVHQLAWAVFWLLMSGVCSVLAVITAFTIVGAVIFGLAGFALWVTALAYSIMALSRR